MKLFTFLRPDLICSNLTFSGACAIEEEQEVTITGGLKNGGDIVIRYTVVNGYHHILPSLKIRRHSHACGHFTNSEGAIVR